MARPRLLICLLLMLTLLAQVAQAQENGTGVTLTARTPYGALYRPYAWLPVYMTVANDGADQRVTLRYGNFGATIDLPGGARKELVLYIRPEMTSNIKLLALASGTDQQLASATIKTRSVVNRVLGVVGDFNAKPLGTEQVKLDPRLLPERVEGYDVLDALVLDGKERIELTPGQLKALQAWVGGGGNLVLTGGSALETTLSQLPESIRPVTAQAADTQPADMLALAGLVGRTDTLEQTDALRLIPTDQSKVIALAGDGRPLLVSRFSGKGQVMALAITLDSPPLTTWRGMDKLWERLAPSNRGLPMMDPTLGIDQFRDEQAPGVLSTLPALALPPLQWLLVLLGIYIVLAGPVSYLVLKRLDRLAWAWGVIPALTLVFALLAYGVGAQDRSSDLILNQVSIVEQNNGSLARVQSYVGIFSPTQKTYSFKAPDEALLRPLQANRWDMGGNSGGSIFYQSPSGVENLEVQQWSMSMLAFNSLLEWQGLDASLTLEGARVKGSVVNQGSQPIRDVVLVVGQEVIRLGTLEPGASAQVNQQLFGGRAFTGEPLSSLIYRDEFQRAGPEGLSREVQLKQLAVDLAVPGQVLMGDPSPVLLGWVEAIPLSLQSSDESASSRQTVMVVERPSFQFGEGEVRIDGTWVKMVSEDSGMKGGDCFTMSGQGISIQEASTTLQLSLPDSMLGLTPASLTFRPEMDGQIPIEQVEISLLNWKTGEKLKLDKKGGAVNNPGDYLTPGGDMQMMVELPKGVADQFGGFWSCFSPGIEIKGRLA